MGIYERLGVRKLVNAYGAVTRIGGSLMQRPVLEAMAEAAQAFVDLDELLDKAGKRIAELLDVEAAFITSGAAAGLAISTAACVAGTDPGKIRRLPDTTGMKNEVVVHKTHRNLYDHALRQVGISFIEIGLGEETYLWELEHAINEKTAAILYVAQFESQRASLPFNEVVKVAKKASVPIIVDAAAELPPSENLTRFVKMGADLTIFSGGKDLRGPQSSGLVLGRKDLIAACAANSNPNHSIGRPMKAGKEEIAGLVVALELYLSQDEEVKRLIWERQADYLVERLNSLPYVTANKVMEAHDCIRPSRLPRVYLKVNEEALGITKDEIILAMKEGEPRVVIGKFQESLVLNTQMLSEGEEAIVAQRLEQVIQTLSVK